MISLGASLEYESGSGWAEVYNVKSVNFPDIAFDPVENTHLGIADFARTYEAGMFEAGNISFESQYTKASYDALTDLALDREAIGWRVTSPDTCVVTCDGFLNSVTVKKNADNSLLMIVGSVKLTGLPVIS